ncbi:tripartite tricarboxylate transporter substrate binding protein [Mycetocola sp.]|uniref:tripartite tricarboxylate transporter substrate binding protein n=1 Tax=Mycetocola sp. TaxID=1871042 RepID=UPI0039892689
MVSTTVKAVAVAGIALLALTGCSASAAEGKSAAEGEFKPSADSRMIVPFSAGGGSDLSGRAIAAGLEEVGGINISTENREGGSGAIGYSHFLAQEGKDNYLLAAETALLALPLTQDVEFEYTDFTPIMKLGDDYTLLVVAPDSPYETCDEVVDAARKDRVVAAVSGATSLDEIVFKLVEAEMDVKFDRVPFESGSEVLAALLGGTIDIASLNPGEVLGQLEAGDLKALCAFSDERYEYEQLAEIPTAKEQGIDVSFAQFRGFIAPGGISDEAKEYWIAQAEKFEKSDAYAKYIEENVMQANAVYGDDFAQYLDGNYESLEKALG